MSLRMFAYVLLALVVCCYILEIFIFTRRHPQEPAYIRPRLPLIGHLVGFIKKGVRYYDGIEASNPNLSVFTLHMGLFKCYVVKDYQLCAPIQRAAKTVSFTPFAKNALKLLKNPSSTIARSRDLFSDDKHTREFAREFQHVTTINLANGPALDSLSLATAKANLKMVDELLMRSLKGAVEIDLFDWVRQNSIVAVTSGFYGPNNPYLDPLHLQNFRVFQAKSAAVASGMGRVLARKAYVALEGMWDAYEAYFDTGGFKTAAKVLQERVRVCLENDTSLSDVAASHASFDIALLSNYVPTSFWVVYDIISRPRLLEDVRKELQDVVVEGQNGTDYDLDISLLRTSCPLLVSSMQETQRMRTCHAAIRKILEDTTISSGKDDYLLKQGSLLQLHTTPLLRSEAFWGEDAEQFNPRRFLRNGGSQEKETVLSSSSLTAQSFPVWGFGPHVCPARYYAFSSMMVTVALTVLRLDITPSGDESGNPAKAMRWREPKSDITLVSGVVQPIEPVRVVVNTRASSEDKWGIRIGTPGTKLKFSVP